MRRKELLCGVPLLCLVAVVWSAAMAQDDEQAGGGHSVATSTPSPETPTGSVEVPAARQLVKVDGAGMPGAWFDHSTHKTDECISCHHQERFDMKCTECHKLQTEGETPDAQLALHENCLQCHVEGGDCGGKAITCVDCHKE